MTLAILASLVAIVVICNLIGWTKFVVNSGSGYSLWEPYCIINLRVGAYHICWGTVKGMERRWGQTWWNPFPIWVEFGRPAQEYESPERLRIGCRWVNVSYRAVCKDTPEHWVYQKPGWHLYGTAPEFIKAHGFWTWFWGWIPKRVWLTESPWDGGPWEFSAEGAAAFIEAESSEEDGGPIKFTPEELRLLWLPGRAVEKNDWSIKCIVIPRWQQVLEWDGW